jgi:glycine cleavage system regulatory protein
VTSASHRLEVLGPDRAGIIKEVSHALSEENINIVAMETRVENAPFTGEPMFKATLEVNVPANVDVAMLHARLEEIAEAMTLEIDLH